MIIDPPQPLPNTGILTTRGEGFCDCGLIRAGEFC